MSAPRPASSAESPVRNGRRLHPLPTDAPLLSIADAASYLRVTPRAMRKLIDEEHSGLADALRSCVIRLSPRRRYLRRSDFLSALERLSEERDGAREGVQYGA